MDQWRRNARICREDGTVILEVTDGWSFNRYHVSQAEGLAEIEWLDPAQRNLLSGVLHDGSILYTHRFPLSVREGFAVGQTIRIGNSYFDIERLRERGIDWAWFPAVFDYVAREVRPILDPFSQPEHISRNYVQAVQTGPFARVVNTGSCLNIRESPATSARVLECVTDDVLVRFPDHPPSIPSHLDDTAWFEVISPGGTRGWASNQYLEY